MSKHVSLKLHDPEEQVHVSIADSVRQVGSMPFRVERNNLIWRRARVRTDEPADA